jgi:predicted RNA binding protein YcfA (HicA-like mRNA interferase family)
MPLTPKEMIKLLKQNGFRQVSQNGSHVKLKNVITKRQVIVPYHSKAMKKGLEQAILKEAGLKCQVNENGGNASE